MAAVEMRGSSYRKQKNIGSARDLYAGRLMPTEQIETCRNTDKLFPTRMISRGGDTKSEYFSYTPKNLDGLEIKTETGSYDLYDYIARNRVTALLVLKEGAIVHESYEYGNTANTRWMSMSMAKSVSTTLVGAAVQDGCIESLDDPLTKYLPILKNGSYDGVTIRQLLLMTSGVQWDETHTNANSERRKVLELQLGQKSGSILEYMSRLPRVAEPGSKWNYSTGETHVVGELLYAATGRYLADYLSEKIWSKIGMESDASWWLEAPDGLEVAGSGISATLRDYARFGQFVMQGGLVGDDQILPSNWLQEATISRTLSNEPLDYGFMWWPLQPPKGAGFEPSFSARGIFGQYMNINPSERTVIVVWSARAKPIGSEVIPDNDFFNAVIGALK